MTKFSKYYTRVDFRRFLNGPGHHQGASVNAYIEDTTARSRKMTKESETYYKVNKDSDFKNLSPKIVLEISDCTHKIMLELDLGKDTTNCNSFHKLDTLIEGLVDLRAGMDEEMKLYRARRKFIESDAKKNKIKRKIREKQNEAKYQADLKRTRAEYKLEKKRSAGDKVMDDKTSITTIDRIHQRNTL